LTVPEFTAYDYQDTTKPFDWLYQYKDNKFLMLRLRDKIKAKAGAVGVKNFVSLWNAYLESKQAQRGIATNNVTQFDGQPLELESGEYICTDAGITTLDRYGFEVMVCPHPILITKRLINIDTGEVKSEIAFSRGHQWKTYIFDKKTLSSSQSIIDLSRYGIAADSENAKELVKYLSAIENRNYDKLGETLSVGRLGWIGDSGFSPYVDGLVFDGYQCYKHIFDSIKQHGDFQKWIDVCREARKGPVITRIVLAASFASVLVDPLEISPFFVHLWGGAGAGKSVGLMLAASVWANPTINGAYITTLNSTAVGQEMTAGFLNSLPLLMDELQVVKDQKSFDQIIYMLCEGVGKGRGAKAGGLQRIQTWRNCIITTGEQPIITSNSGAGAALRVLEIDCKGEQLFSEPRKVVSALKKNYGFAGRKLVEYLMADGAMDEFKQSYSEEFQALQSGEIDDKQSLIGAIIITADKLSTSLFFNDGAALTQEDIKPLLTTKNQSDANRRAYEWILDFVASNPAKFVPGDFGYQGECWGKVEGDLIYFNKSIFDSKMSEAGYSSTSFLSWAKRNGKIICDYQGKSTKTTRIKGVPGTPRCVCLKSNCTDKEDDNSDIDENYELPY
jgi:hypothetical protein